MPASSAPASHPQRGIDRSETRLFARTEGVILDPIYIGKAAVCMVAHIQEGRYARDDSLIFVHTGGTPKSAPRL